MNRRTDDKRTRILDAAVVEIARAGFFGTTVAKIARRAGVADGTIYLYFENKEAILVGVFDRAMDRFIGGGVQELGSGRDARALLQEIVQLHLELVGQDHDLAIILQVELRHSLQFMNLFSRTRLREYLEIIAGVVEQGKREGVVRGDMDSMFAAKMVFGALDQVATDWILADDNSRLSGRAERVWTFLETGLFPLDPGTS